MVKNVSVLLGGKAFNAVASLGYLALAARALGAEAFGLLILVHTFTQAVGQLVTFQSWQAVIRYGAEALEQQRRAAFQGLIKFTLLLDLVSATAGVALAAIAAPWIGQYLEWPPEVAHWASLYSGAVLFMVTATPTGLLRLFDRFDLIALQGAVGPLIRLAGAAALAVTGGSLGDFLIVWFVANVAGGTTFLAFAFRELKRRKLLGGMGWSLRGLAKPHAGIWRFVWATNLNTGLGLATKHFSVIAVGWILGPAEAGALRVARQFAEALAKPAKLLAPVIYPELAKLSAQGKGDVLTRLVRRSILTAGTLGLVVLLVVVVAGKMLLQLTVGPEFLGAYGVMILLCLAAVINITAFPLEPLLITAGRAGTVLRVRLLATLIQVPLLLLLLTLTGLLGAGSAAVVYAALLFVGLGISAAPWLRSRPA